jgi:hypothetical protein
MLIIVSGVARKLLHGESISAELVPKAARKLGTGMITELSAGPSTS